MNIERANRVRAGLGLAPIEASLQSPSLPLDVERSALSVGRSLRSPGDIFGIVIHKITGQRTANCGECGRRKAQMNKWGWLGCLRPKNRKQIIDWLCEEAAKRGHEIDGNQMLALFKAAIKELLGKRVDMTKASDA